LLELDLVLEAFMRTDLEQLAPAELAAFQQLLDASDNELWDWVSARSEPGDPTLLPLIGRLRAVQISR